MQKEAVRIKNCFLFVLLKIEMIFAVPNFNKSIQINIYI